VGRDDPLPNSRYLAYLERARESSCPTEGARSERARDSLPHAGAALPPRTRMTRDHNAPCTRRVGSRLPQSQSPPRR
jgi:hypothetical protein